MTISKKWLKLIGGILLLLFACSFFGMIAGNRHDQRYSRYGVDEEYSGYGFNDRHEYRDSDSPISPGESTHRTEEWDGYSRGEDAYDNHGYGYGKHRSFRLSPIIGVFALLGGLVRLAGLAALIFAGILFFRNRQTPGSSSNNAGDDEDDSSATGMSEEQIRAAMKELGIDKIEL